MTENRIYRIRVNGKLIEVTKEVYLVYHKMERHLRTLEEKDKRNRRVLYSALDTEEMLGEETIPDIKSISVEDTVIKNVLLENLRQCVAQLTREERELIHALYFEEMTEREYARKIGLSQRGINRRRKRTLDKLKDMMKI